MFGRGFESRYLHKKNSSLHPSLLEGKELFFLYRMPSADWRDYEEIPIYHSSLHPSLLEGKELFFFVQDAVGRLKGLQRNPAISTKSFLFIQVRLSEEDFFMDITCSYAATLCILF